MLGLRKRYRRTLIGFEALTLSCKSMYERFQMRFRHNSMILFT